ncbi:MAG: hypothetical protein GWP61_16780 [Chloroflexi bacterium]|jgi:hypothetical protein|nr:hypothetical protein [Chloroflexota bacterium]
MVNFKAFAILVIVATGVFIVALSSLAADDQEQQIITVSDAAQLPSFIDDSGVEPLSSQPSGDHLPLMIRWSNWRPEFGPSYVYARERDLSGMLALDAPVEKMLMVTSYAEVQRAVERANELQAAGITTIGFNSENGTGMTPGNEMQTLNSPDPEVNVVARAAKLATGNGFEMMWGPVRRTVDSLSDEAVRTMISAGVSGLAMQEQKFIETQGADSRLTAVMRSRDRYLRLAREVGVDDFTFHVQIMHQRCPNMPNCVTFVEGLEDIPVDSIAIWSNGPIPVDFVKAIRME